MTDGSRFAERTERVLATANDESARLRHEYVGTEHVLLGLLGETDGVCVTVLHSLGVDFDALRRQVETTVELGRSQNPALLDRPITSRTRRVLELAAAEAEQLGNSIVGSEHLLLGLLVEAHGLGGQILQSAGVTADAVRAGITRVVGPPRGSA